MKTTDWLKVRKKHKAFTLAEILTSVAILGVVMAAVLTLFYSTFESYQFHQDVMEAKQRGHVALAAIGPYISGAALGISSKTDNFQRAFAFDGNQPNFTPPAPVFLTTAPGVSGAGGRFTGPVQLAADGAVLPAGDHEGGELWIVYATASAVGVEQEYEVGPEAKELTLTGPLAVEGNKNTLKSWIVFPAGLAPVFVNLVGVNNRVTVSSHLNQKVFPFEEAHYLRGVKIKAENNALYVLKSDGSGNQPVVDGVEALWAAYDGDGDRVLKVTILARGDTRHNAELQSSVDGWPPEAPQPKDRHYRYSTVARSWRIRN